MSNYEWVPRELIGQLVSRMNMFLDDAIHDAQSSLDLLREMRRGTTTLLDSELDQDELTNLERTFDDIESACSLVGRTRDQLERLT